MGALAALHHRSRTGEGQIVDSALYEAVLQVMESTVADYSASGTKRRRTGSTLPGIAPSNVYPCRDGEYLIGANQEDRKSTRLTSSHSCAIRLPSSACKHKHYISLGIPYFM